MRDLRDIYCSYRNYFHATSEEAIQIVTSYGKRMLVIKEYDSQASIFLRYEDCIRDPSLAARDLSDFLGIKIVDMGAKDGALFARHATSHSIESSMGRWRHDLVGDELLAFTKAAGASLSKFNKTFGYE